MRTLRILVVGLPLLLALCPAAASGQKGLLIRGQGAAAMLKTAEALLGPEIASERQTTAHRELVVHRFHLSAEEDLLLYETSGVFFQARKIAVGATALPQASPDLRLTVPPRAYVLCRSGGKVSFLDADTCDDFLKREWVPAWKAPKKHS